MPEGAGSAAQSLAVEPHVEASKSTVSTPAKPAKPDVSNDTGYHQSFVHPHQPSAQSMAGPAAAIAGAIAGVAINRIEESKVRSAGTSTNGQVRNVPGTATITMGRV